MLDMCFARKKNGCSALETGCPGFSECAFYKTRKQQNESLERAHARLRSLPADQQAHISEAYYFGTMPWRKGRKAADV